MIGLKKIDIIFSVYVILGCIPMLFAPEKDFIWWELCYFVIGFLIGCAKHFTKLGSWMEEDFINKNKK